MWSAACLICCVTKDESRREHAICDTCAQALYEFGTTFPPIDNDQLQDLIRNRIGRVLQETQRAARQHALIAGLSSNDRHKVSMACAVHTCAACRDPINIGNDYVKVSRLTHEGWQTFHYHLRCDQ